VGGFISDTLGWRWAFLIQLPILACSFVLVWTFVKYRVPGQGKNRWEMVKRIDYLGTSTLIICIGSLLLALSFKNNENMPWSSPLVWGFAIMFVVFLALFITVEIHVSIDPVMPIRILKDRSAVSIAIVNFITSMNAFSSLYFYPMWFQAVKLTTSSDAGLHLIPNSFALAIGSLFAGWYMRRFGRYYWLTTLCSALPVISFTLMSLLKPNSHFIFQWGDIVGTGFGLSVIITSTLIALITNVDRKDMAVATAISYLFRYTGQVVGVGLSSAVLQGVLTAELHKHITGPGSEKLIADIRHDASIISGLPPDQREAAVLSYQIGLQSVFIMNACLAFVCLLATLPIREYPLPNNFLEEEQARKAREHRDRESSTAQNGEAQAASEED